MNLLLESSSGFGMLLIVAYIIIGVLLGGAIVFAAVSRFILFVRYHNLKGKKNTAGFTAYSAARNLLDANGMTDIKIEKLGFFRAAMYGNSYNRKKKTIYLRRNIVDSDSILAVGLALQKIGLVVMDKQNDKQFIRRAKMQPFMLLAPVAFIPIVLIGLVFDIILSKAVGVGTIITTILAAAFYIISMIYELSTIKVEKRANQKAMEIMVATNFLNEEERMQIQKVFDSYILSYIAEFVVTLLQFIKFILELIIKLVSAKARK